MAETTLPGDARLLVLTLLALGLADRRRRASTCSSVAFPSL
jgi:hypothetical protein